MILLHRKSIIDCYDDYDFMIHKKEVTQILEKIQTMYNYECFVLVLDELWKLGDIYRVVDYSTHHCHLHDVVDWFLDKNNKGFEFAVDEGDLLMMSYHEKVGRLSYVKRTVAISALVKDGQYKKHHPIENEFLKLCAKNNLKLYKYTK